MAYRDLVIADAPVEYWEFNETTGTNAASTGSTPHAATHSGGVLVGQSGIGSAKAVTYNGIDGLTTTSTAVTDYMNGTNFTVELWVRFDGSYTNDYPTFFRRDGSTHAFLIRTRNVSVGQQHTIETYFNGKTITTGTTTFNDDKWHHVVVTKATSTVRLFVDNVEYTTNTGTVTLGGTGATAGFIGRGAGAGEYFKGSIDEVAVYTTALSTTRIAAHYTGSVVPVAYTATAMTGSGTMPNAVLPNVNVNATATTGSGTMPNATVSAGRSVSVAATAMSGSATTPTAAAVGTKRVTPTGLFLDGNVLNPMNITAGRTVSIRTPLPSGFSDAGKVSANLVFAQGNGDGGSGSTYTISKITAPWANTDSTFTTGPSLTFQVPDNNGIYSYDVTSLVTQSGFYGLTITTTHSTGTLPIDSFIVFLDVAYASVTSNTGVTADPFTGSGNMPTATTRISTDVNYAAYAMIGFAATPTAAASTQRDVNVAVEPMTASGQMPAALRTSAIVYGATAMLGSAMTPTGVASTTIGAVVKATAMAGTAKFVTPALVNGKAIVEDETEDAYFVRVSSLSPSVWWRMRDTNGILSDRVSGATVGTPSATVHNAVVGNHDAPQGRASIKFTNGAWVEQNEPAVPGNPNVDEMLGLGTSSIARTTLEFSFRTNKSNEFLMAGQDQVTSANGTASPGGATELYLKNGKIGYRTYAYGTTGGAGGTNSIGKEFEGITNLSDNEWHHVVIRSGVRSPVRDEYGVEIWIDGKFEVRRYFAQSWIGLPDYLGGRPAMFDAASLPQLPSSQYFEGDMSEIVWYGTREITTDDISRNFYAFMGWKPVYAEPMTAEATAPTVIAKGNQKKALYLYWTGQDEVFGGLPGKANQPASESLSFDPNPGLAADAYSAPLAPRVTEEAVDFAGYKVFTKSITIDYTDGMKSYRDPVTDEQSLINLQTDINLADYDVIMFKNWPDEGYELEYYENVFPGQKDRLLAQIRQANDNGMELLVTNPRLAVDLGIVNKLEFVPTLRETKFNSAQGQNAFGYYDYKSAIDFPWNISFSDGLTGGDYAAGIGEPEDLSPAYLNNKAYYYYDTNDNNRFRVRALVDGLTDIPSYMIEKAVWHTDADIYGWQGLAMKYLHRLNGLQIGDEYIFEGSAIVDPAFQEPVAKRYQRYNGTWATPPSGVVAGTVVTTFSEKYWKDNVELTNPYKDYATTIVLDIGDNLGGRPVGGRIFVNFSEQPMGPQAAPYQILPNGTNGIEWPRNYGGKSLSNANIGRGETAAQMEWDYSWTRTTTDTTGIKVINPLVSIIMPDGTLQSFRAGSGTDSKLSMVRSNQLFELAAQPRLEMVARGLSWLGKAPTVNPGDVTVRVKPMEATATMGNATGTGQKSTTVIAKPMTATATMPAAKEARDGSITVLATAMLAEGTFTSGNNKVVKAEAMTATATMPGAVNLASYGEEVTLTLRSVNSITLYLKEDD